MEQSPSQRITINWWLVRFLQKGIRLYQWISPIVGPRCRFIPSCSNYMKESLEQWGLWKGLGKGFWRLLKCHPWHPGGLDPVVLRHHAK